MKRTLFKNRKTATGSSRGKALVNSKKGMELVQVAILIGIAVAVGLIFKTQITNFVNDIFGGLSAKNYLG